MLAVMDKKVRNLSVRIAMACFVLLAVVHGQGQNAQTKKTDGSTPDLTPVTLSMKWPRGDRHYGPNFIWLSTPCQASGDVPCECTMTFKVINSKGFADYISSFGDGQVPVVYQVMYGADGFARGQRLESVGSWQADRFHLNEQALSVLYTFKGGKPGQKQPAHTNGTADCFPPKRN
jgi:hypothetical protein